MSSEVPTKLLEARLPWNTTLAAPCWATMPATVWRALREPSAGLSLEGFVLCSLASRAKGDEGDDRSWVGVSMIP